VEVIDQIEGSDLRSQSGTEMRPIGIGQYQLRDTTGHLTTLINAIIDQA
jgi:hypothetical protein